MLNQPSTVTGTLLSGVTSPVFTLTSDSSAVPYRKKSIVSSISGTGLSGAHTLSNPFYVESLRSENMKALPPYNSVTGAFKDSVPKNVVAHYIRKGMTVLSGAPLDFGDIRITSRVPAGADSADPTAIKSMWSLAAAYCVAMAQGSVDTHITGAA